MQIIKCTPNIIEEYKEQFIELYRELIYIDYPEKIEEGLLTRTDFKNSIEKIQSYISTNQGIVFVSIEEDTICGYVHGYIRNFLDEKRMMLDSIIVNKKYRRAHIGQMLQKQLEQYAKNENCDVMELFVTTNNPKGEIFHRGNGFIDSRLQMIKKLK